MNAVVERMHTGKSKSNTVQLCWREIGELAGPGLFKLKDHRKRQHCRENCDRTKTSAVGVLAAIFARLSVECPPEAQNGRNEFSRFLSLLRWNQEDSHHCR